VIGRIIIGVEVGVGEGRGAGGIDGTVGTVSGVEVGVGVGVSGTGVSVAVGDGVGVNPANTFAIGPERDAVAVTNRITRIIKDLAMIGCLIRRSLIGNQV